MIEVPNSIPLPLTELTAITPPDGRYGSKTQELRPFVSEYALIKTRIEVEAKYLIALSDIGVVRKLTQDEKRKLNSFGSDLSIDNAEKIKKIEEETRHDVKAMEKAFRNTLAGTSLEDVTEMVHFGLTSEDINNISYRLMLKRTTENIIIPTLDKFTDELVLQAMQHKETPMLARTHGQAAVPTTLGKEIVNFASRLNKETRKLEKQQLTGKLTGAVGNFNALKAAYPDTDWISFSENFIKSFGLKPNLTTTQINPYEDMAEYFQNYIRINNVLIDFDQDVWRYVSDNWFVQQVKKGEVGSSTMPQKVNPIDFENSEGNLGIANAIFEFFSRKLPISRLQRDLSDSTVIRNIGTALGFSLVAYKSVTGGLSRVAPNLDEIKKCLNRDWTILTEGAQTLLRRDGVDDPYSLMAKLTRGGHINGQKEWIDLIDETELEENQKANLKKLTPQGYVGLASELTERAIIEIKSSRDI
jgi:adenylosuccinate lyase